MTQGRKVVDRRGQRFGKLVVLSLAKERKNGRTIWLCKCDCGKLKKIRGDCLTSRGTRSCGCLFGEWQRQHRKAWRNQRILIRYRGLGGAMTMQQIADSEGISRQRVHQIIERDR